MFWPPCGEGGEMVWKPSDTVGLRRPQGSEVTLDWPYKADWPDSTVQVMACQDQNNQRCIKPLKQPPFRLPMRYTTLTRPLNVCWYTLQINWKHFLGSATTWRCAVGRVGGPVTSPPPRMALCSGVCWWVCNKPATPHGVVQWGVLVGL